MRYFNTSGPNIVAEHYTLMRPQLVAEGLDKIHKNRYFTIWAPRQTGKSTYFRLLADRLETEGYQVAYVNFENYKESDMDSFLYEFHSNLSFFWGYDWRGLTLQNTFSKISEIEDKKLVLIIDEVEGINPDFFGQFLHSIRNVYHSRSRHGLKSVILVGVSNIVGVVQDNASPFNIADNLNVPYFTDEETLELLGQHETETGQLFDPSVKKKISDITANQPGLVNGFARLLVENHPQKKMINYQDYLVIENWYLTKGIDKNISNIINKAKMYRPFIERLLFKGTKVEFQIYREDIRELYVNGIITYNEDGFVVFRVPLYQKCLYSAFYPYMNGEGDRIRGYTDVDTFLLPDGRLDIEKIIKNYKEYAARKGFRYFREKNPDGTYVSLKEAALMYSFDTYINALMILVGGKTYLEPSVALGRSDMIISALGYEYVVETKVYSDTVQFAEGKTQLAYYIKKLNLTTGIYLVFVRSTITNEKIKEGTDIIDGVEINTHIVRYDLKTDFKDKKRKKNQDDDDDDDD
jgi:predicted AAA+ superfamily ATPase